MTRTVLTARLPTLRSALAIVALVASCAGTEHPAPSRRDALEVVVRDAAAHGFAGNVLVQWRGREVLFDSVGLANEELGVPHQRTTRFKVHSTTKPLTAAAVLLLVGDGKLDLDRPISVVLPGLPPAWSAITLRHLLQHTSGIPPEVEKVWLEAWEQVDSDNELDVLAAAVPKFADRLASRPGETWAYSNMGYVLVTCIVARQAGMPFTDFVHDRIFVPAGMRDSVFDAQARVKHDVYSGNAVVPRLASGYNGKPQQLETTFSRMYMERGAGGLITTADDLARFAAAVWSGPLLGARQRAMIFDRAYGFDVGTERERSYGLGWATRRREGRRVIKHDGGNNGFVADLEIWPDDELVIIAMSNHGFFDDLGGMVERLARAALAAP
jgi:D-alanyl-D-alanine carboxypeptidase